MPNFTFDPIAHRYRAENGRFVKREAVIHGLERGIEETRDRLVKVSQDLKDGRINLAQWQLSMRDEIKAMHLAAAAIARGGKERMSPAELGLLGGLARLQYSRLNRFALQIQNGEQKLDGRFMLRVQMYADAGRGTFCQVERRSHKQAGFDEERNILHPAEHCEGCLEEDGKGWVPIGTLIPIGGRICLTNDKCTVSYRRSKAA